MVWSTKAVVFGSIVASVVALVVYGISNEFHVELELLATVVAIRLSAGFGIGLVIGALVGITAFVLQRKNAFTLFLKTASICGMTIICGLIFYNIV
jgi:hypothetical protein